MERSREHRSAPAAGPGRALLIGSQAAIWHGLSWRPTADWDLYCDASFGHYLEALPQWQTVHSCRRTRKLVGTLDGLRVDCTISACWSWVTHVLDTDPAGLAQLGPITIPVASLTTLTLIQDVLSHWPEQWRKHATDYCALTPSADAYNTAQQRAWVRGMRCFTAEFKQRRDTPTRLPDAEIAQASLDELDAIAWMLDARTLRRARLRCVP